MLKTSEASNALRVGLFEITKLARRKPQGYDLVCSLYDQIAAGRRRISWQVSGQ